MVRGERTQLTSLESIAGTAPDSGANRLAFSPRLFDASGWWAHQDSNLEPTDYESAALTIEL